MRVREGDCAARPAPSGRAQVDEAGYNSNHRCYVVNHFKSKTRRHQTLLPTFSREQNVNGRRPCEVDFVDSSPGLSSRDIISRRNNPLAARPERRRVTGFWRQLQAGDVRAL